MKTTLVINDRIMLKVKEEAIRTGRNISELVETALSEFLKPKKKGANKGIKTLPSFNSGRCYVDISSRDDLFNILDTDKD